MPGEVAPIDESLSIEQQTEQQPDLKNVHYESDNQKQKVMMESNMTDMAAKDFIVDQEQHKERLNTDPIEPSEPMLEKIDEQKLEESPSKVPKSSQAEENQ